MSLLPTHCRSRFRLQPAKRQVAPNTLLGLGSMRTMSDSPMTADSGSEGAGSALLNDQQNDECLSLLLEHARTARGTLAQDVKDRFSGARNAYFLFCRIYQLDRIYDLYSKSCYLPHPLELLWIVFERDVKANRLHGLTVTTASNLIHLLSWLESNPSINTDQAARAADLAQDLIWLIRSVKACGHYRHLLRHNMLLSAKMSPLARRFRCHPTEMDTCMSYQLPFLFFAPMGTHMPGAAALGSQNALWHAMVKLSKGNNQHHGQHAHFSTIQEIGL